MSVKRQGHVCRDSNQEEQQPLQLPGDPRNAVSYLATKHVASEQRQEEDMQEADYQGPISPETQANWYQHWTLSWMNELYRIGFKRQLQEEDLYQVMEQHRASVLGQRLRESWEAEKIKAQKDPKMRSPSLLRAIVRTFWREYFPGYIYLELGDVCQITSPMILEMILKFIQDSQVMVPPPPASTGYGLAIAAFLQAVAQTSIYQRWNVRSISTGIFVRTALIDLVFRKATTISAKSHLLYPDGSIINMMSTDISRIDAAMLPFLIAIATPFYVLAIVILLVRLMGPSALLGAVILMLSNPIQGWGMSKLGSVRKKASQFTDSRIRLSTEILQGIKAIKFFAWEESFLAKLAEIRSKELALVGKLLATRGFITATSGAVPVFASALSFALYAALGNTLQPQIVFPALAFYSIMRVPLLILPNCYTTAVDAYVSIGRLQKFLLSEDTAIETSVNEFAEDAILIENADFIWETLASASSSARPSTVAADSKQRSTGNDQPVHPLDSAAESSHSDNIQTATPYLRNINLKIARGALVAIVGPVGSGKSSLLQAIVGNMTQRTGSISRGTTISYASQTPWIQNASIRNNILFDTTFEEERYRRVVECCCLEQDLASFPDGDLTEIGERGVNLSGGQKARLSLARSVYFNAGTVVMDDPLSAVDAHVGKRLWTDCILDELKGKTRVIATHQLHVLPSVDYVIYMKGGAIAAEGTYPDLMAQGGEFKELMAQYGGAHHKKHKAAVATNGPRVSQDPESSSTVHQHEGSFKGGDSEQSSESGEQNDGETEVGDLEAKTAPVASKLVTEEEREIGAVKMSVYADYFTMTGVSVWSAVLFCYVVQQVCNVMMNYWLSLWSDQKLDLSTTVCIAVYMLFAIAQFVVVVIASQLLSYAIISTANKMHSRAFDKVIHAPLSFYDTTPIGRILNRFSKDVDALDNVLWGTLNDIFVTLFIVLSTITLIVIFFPYLIIAIVPMACLYYGISIYYRSTSREIKRLDSTLRSILYAYFSESLTGMGTLRAYNRIQHAISVNQQRVDLGNRAYYLFTLGTRWIAYRIQILGALLIFMTSMFVVGTRFTINAASAGLVLSYLVKTSGELNWVVQCFATLENNMNSAERLVHYVKKLPQEPPVKSRPDLKPAVTWPDKGVISFKNVSLRYRPELPQVLRDISFDIQSGHKVGVVGRTGAGKSSLIQALFLLSELDGGQILLDGIDTQTIGTADLRSHIAIIPQDPVLFQGTFRYNLDPLEKHSEQELWQVLETSDLKTYVQAQEGGLDATVTVNGENLSAGQRQLVCLSRALLAKSKVVVLDEATASVDMATDALIQKAIRVDFSTSTVITIAHRINTIIDYDRILVMQQGQLEEYDTPRNLLNDPNSAFSVLVAETGAQNATHLRSLAGL
ncbi:P-loop containing nucleoside triphosphate hydrolase protein [Dissophora ornata]|nr:hypothetical protein BGZ58_007762 [Dissophora ornata]KAI8604818.1 P-loop containing nucleoside triphosphate hydrolase protein [Dissophora ornata]